LRVGCAHCDAGARGHEGAARRHAARPAGTAEAPGPAPSADVPLGNPTFVPPVGTPTPDADAPPRIPLADARKLYDAGQALFVDVRSASTYADNHIRGPSISPSRRSTRTSRPIRRIG